MMMYLMNETILTIERMNEFDRFKSRKRSTELWIQVDAEFLLDKVPGKEPLLWYRVIAVLGDILISSGEKLKAWSST